MHPVFVVALGTQVLIFCVCDECGDGLTVRWPETWRTCGCGARVFPHLAVGLG